MSKVKIAALFKFVQIENPEAFKESLQAKCRNHDVYGMLILGHEGLNGTIAAEEPKMDAFLAEFMSDPRFTEGVEIKYAYNESQPFYRMRISIRKEIVTLGLPDFEIKPSEKIHLLQGEDWNDAISRPDVMVIDTRNDYEYDLGTFENAIDPNTQNFRQFPSYVEQEVIQKGVRNVAMFCTGGIRCEKAAAYLAQFDQIDNVYNLKGGILRYLENVDEQNSKWKGECFVFDQRVTVGHGLVPGNCQLCRGCRHPLTEQDRSLPSFREGIHCKYCVEKLTPEQIKGAEERHKQMLLAEERHVKHLGYVHQKPSNKRFKSTKQTSENNSDDQLEEPVDTMQANE